MKYYSEFRDLNGKLYKVNIITNGDETTQLEIKLGGSPFTTEMDKSDSTIYKPCKYQSASIEIITAEYLFDVYNSTAQNTKIELLDESNNVMWTGFGTPNIYNQGFNYDLETITIEAIDALASLQYIKYKPVGENKNAVSVLLIIRSLLKKCKSYKNFYITDNIQKSNTSNDSICESIYLNELNFFKKKSKNLTDDDVAWKCSDVLEEVCRYLGYTCIAVGDSVYFIDYDAIRLGINTYYFYSINDESVKLLVTLEYHKLVKGLDHSETGATLSIDNTYNKIKVKDDLYTYELVIPSIFENLEDITSVFENDNSWFNYTNIGRHYIYNTNNDAIEFVDKLNNPLGQNIIDVFVSIRYKKSNNYRGKIYNLQLEDVTDNYNSISFTDTINNFGSVIAEVFVLTLDFEDDWSFIKARKRGETTINTITWNEFWKRSDVYETTMAYFEESLRITKPSYTQYVLFFSKKNEEDSDCAINNSNYQLYPYFEGTYDLNYIYGGINKKFLLTGTYGFAGEPTNSEMVYPHNDAGVDISNGRVKASEFYLPAKLLVGDLYWNGSSWVSEESLFKIKFEVGHSSADMRMDNIMFKNWSFENNVMWSDNFSTQGTLIPIPTTICTNSPKITLYKPNRFDNTPYNQYLGALKEFSIKVATKSDDNNDVEYSNIINSDYVNELGDISFKINTWADKGQNYSATYYKKSNGELEFLDTIYNKALGELQKGTERNNGTISNTGELNAEELLIWKLSNQYTNPAVKLDFNLRMGNKIYGLYSDATINDRYFIIDNIDVDYKQCQQSVTLVEKFGTKDYLWNKCFNYKLNSEFTENEDNLL